MRTLAVLTLGVCLLIVFTGPTAGQTAQDEAKKVLDKAIQAHGGEKVLASAKAAQTKVKGNLSMGGMELPFTAEIYSQDPDRFKVTISLDIMNMNIDVIQCYDGKKGWMSVNGMVMDLPADVEKEMKNTLYVEQIAGLLPLRKKGFKLSTLGEVKVEGKEALGLQVSKEGQQDVNLYFDKKTHMLVKSEYRAKDQGAGQEVTQEKFYNNYKKLADGNQIPMKLIMRNDGKAFLDMDVTDVRILDKHDDSIFARP